MNMKIRRIIGITLSIAMAVSMVGCTKKNSQSSAPAAGDGDPLGKYETPIEITYALKSSAAQKFLPGGKL